MKTVVAWPETDRSFRGFGADAWLRVSLCLFRTCVRLLSCLCDAKPRLLPQQHSLSMKGEWWQSVGSTVNNIRGILVTRTKQMENAQVMVIYSWTTGNTNLKPMKAEYITNVWIWVQGRLIPGYSAQQKYSHHIKLYNSSCYGHQIPELYWNLMWQTNTV